MQGVVPAHGRCRPRWRDKGTRTRGEWEMSQERAGRCVGSEVPSASVSPGTQSPHSQSHSGPIRAPSTASSALPCPELLLVQPLLKVQ